MELSEHTLLGGRVRLRQPSVGLRAGHDAVLLAAAVPARAGETVIELGCGSGAAFLCLMARVPGLSVVAVERDPALAALAAENAALNGWADHVRVITGDVADPALRGALPRVAHGLANPPFWEGGSPPPEAVRRAATHESGVALADWARCMAAALGHKGSATLILPAGRFADGLAALAEAGLGSPALLPLWPRVGVPAKRAILSGRKGGKAPARLLPGLVLHERGGNSAAAAAILRDAAALEG